MADAQETLEPPAQDATVEQPVAEAPAAEQPKPAKEKKGKEKKEKKGKAPELLDGPSVAGHPRAARSIERAKGWGALTGFLAGFYFSLPTHTFPSAGLRAILAGTVLYIAAWAGSVFFWRRMVMIEMRAREQQLLSAAQAAHARSLAAQEAGG